MLRKCQGSVKDRLRSVKKVVGIIKELSNVKELWRKCQESAVKLLRKYQKS